MSTTIDQRVIQMKFDNDEFERRVSKTLGTLDSLKSKMNFAGAEKGLTDLSATAKNFSLAGIGQGIEDLKSKFTALSIVGITALTNIANRAVNAGLQFTKSFTLGPISQGFADYNTKLNSVQTIMNATGASIGTVNKYFDQLDTYADKTIYNLTDMTSAFAKFTNAGIPMEKAIPAIKGIANMTALAGQGADAAQIAYYNLSQSLSAGFLTTVDYKSLNLANIATVEWKQHVVDAAVAAGTLKKTSKGLYILKGGKDAVNMQSLFNDQLSKGWATAGVLTKVLGDYGSETTAIGKKSLAAAQNVKSLPMMLSTLKEAIGTQWTSTFQNILGNVTESTSMFTNMTNAISKVISASGNARNKMLGDWHHLNGRKVLIEGVANVWNALGAVIKPISTAFRDIFPRKTGAQLLEMTKQFREFTSHLMISKDSAENLHRTFEGVFAILKIGTTIISQIIKGFFGLFGTVGTGTGGFLAMTAVVGDFFTNLQKMLDKTHAIENFFAVLRAPITILKPVVEFLVLFADALASLARGDVSGFTSKFKTAFSALGGIVDAIQAKVNAFVSMLTTGFNAASDYLTNFSKNISNQGGKIGNTLGGLAASAGAWLGGFGKDSLGNVNKTMDNIATAFAKFRDTLDFKAAFASFNSGLNATSGSMSGFSAFAEKIAHIWTDVSHAFSAIGNFFAPVANAFRDFFAALGKKMREWISGMDMNDAVSLINTGFIIALYAAFRKVMGNISQLVNAIEKTFSQLTSNLKAMQHSVQADTLLKIAAAVAILVAAVFTLSKIDPKALGVAMAGLTGLFIQMGLAIKFIDFDQKKLFSGSAGLILLAVAIKLLAGAVKEMSSISWPDMIKGLIGVGVLLAGLTLFTKFAEVENGGVKAGAGLLLLATAITLLVGAVKLLGSMDVSTLAKGIGSLMVLLGMLVVATLALETTLPGARAIIILAGALAILAPVLALLGVLPYEVLAKGLGAVAIALTILVIAANAAEAALPGAAAILVIAAALAVLAPALLLFGQMSWESIAKGMVVLAGSLTILVIAANAAEAALPGAAAIFVIAAALAVLAPVLVLMGQMSWESIAKGITMLAAVLAIVVVAMYALTPVIAILSLFSGAIVVLGAGLLLAGGGMFLFATALAALSVSGAAGFAVLIVGIKSFLAILPSIVVQFGLVLIAVAKVVGAAAPAIIEAMVKIALAMLKGIDEVFPKMVDTFGRMVVAVAKEVAKRAPQVYAAGLDMIIGFLQAVKSRIGTITNLAIDIVVGFLGALKGRLPNIIQAGIELIVSFMNGLADGIRKHKQEMADAGVNIGSAIVEGLVAGLGKGKDAVIQAAKDLANKLPYWAKKVLGISSPSKVFEQIGQYVNEGLAKGLMGNRDAIMAAYSNTQDLLDKAISDTTDTVTKAQQKLSDLTAARDKDDFAIKQQTTDVGQAKHELDKLTAAHAAHASQLAAANKTLDAAKKHLADVSQVRRGESATVDKATDRYNAAKKALDALIDSHSKDKIAVADARTEYSRAKENLTQVTSAYNKNNAEIKRSEAAVKSAQAAIVKLNDTDKANVERITAAQQAYDKAKQKLIDLTTARDKDQQAIADTTAELANAQDELTRANAASAEWKNNSAGEAENLARLADQYDEYKTKIEDADKALQDITRTRDDFDKQVHDQFAALPDIAADTTFTDYVAGLTKDIENTQSFATAIQQLREMGLDDNLYKSLLSKGAEALPFIQNVLSGGQTSVDELNTLETQLDTAAQSLGDTTSASLYQAGVDAAQGLLDGLKSQQGAIADQMQLMADTMINVLKAELQIQSPSRIFMKIGVFTNQGLAQGLKDSSPMVEKVAGDVGDNVVSALTKTISGMADLVPMNMDLQPTITPVLDLSGVKKDALQLSSMLPSQAIDVQSAYDKARAADAGYIANQTALAEAQTQTADQQPVGDVIFNQTNNSPKALTPAEIYRNTNNQISQAKGVLTGAKPS